MARYFETFHVLQHPTYTSKYPPANALVIAAGWAVSGRPIVGVWLSFAFMGVACYWMFRAWLGNRWGLAVGVANTVWIGLSEAMSYWGTSYWGGALAAGAGALVMGALYRIVQRQAKASAGVALGVGLLLLANTRPFEGLLLALPAAFALLGWWRRTIRVNRGEVLRVAVPLTVIMAVGFAAMGTYNSAVTGSWRKMPYSAYQEARDPIPVFLWQQAAPMPTATNVSFEKFVTWEDSVYRSSRTPAGRFSYVRRVVRDYFGHLVPEAALFPLVLLPWTLRKRWTRFAIGVIVLSCVGMGLTTWFQIHYGAPMLGLALVVYGECLRKMARLRLGTQPVGAALSAAALLFWMLAGAMSFIQTTPRSSSYWSASGDWPTQRQLIADTLTRTAPRSLAIVRYGPNHKYASEWVYNAADIDAAPMVWARDFGDAGNAPLLAYFKSRAVWIVDVNGESGPFRVTRYSPP